MQDQDRRQAQRETIKAEASRRGIKIERREQCFRLTGPGVSVLCADLGDLSETDLQPYQPRKHVEA